MIWIILWCVFSYFVVGTFWLAALAWELYGDIKSKRCRETVGDTLDAFGRFFAFVVLSPVTVFFVPIILMAVLFMFAREKILDFICKE